MICKWCHREDGCDCQERMDCDKEGQPGHMQCGLIDCGCPAFMAACSGLCEK